MWSQTLTYDPKLNPKTHSRHTLFNQKKTFKKDTIETNFTFLRYLSVLSIFFVLKIIL